VYHEPLFRYTPPLDCLLHLFFMNNVPTTVWKHLDSLAKPHRSLGRLEEIAVLLATTQNRLDVATTPRRMVVFAGDHGVVSQGVTPWSSHVTCAMVRTILKGKATSSVLAKIHSVDVRVINMGMVDSPIDHVSPFFRDASINRGTKDLSIEPAMTLAECDKAWDVGAEEAVKARDEGFRLVIAGEMGIGNTTSSACLTHLLTTCDAATATGFGSGADEEMRRVKRDIVARSVARFGGIVSKEAIAALSGFETMAIAGFYATAARCGLTVLLDGYVTTAGALIAEHFCPGTKHTMIASHNSAEPGHSISLSHLGLIPLLDWKMRLGEGTGALVALPLLDSAAALLTEVASLNDVINLMEESCI
jgi:nicotinate-nucleotide--dimethylbenzimidazole phosphoribosyltransferase